MQRKRKGNDRQAYQSHIKRQEAYERGWLDDADEEYPDYGEAEAYDTEKMAGLVRGQPVVSGYEALERRRGRRKPPRKLTRREKRAMKKAEKMNEKLRREQEKAEKKAAKKEAKLAAKEERAALKKEKKKKHKTVNYSAASEKPGRKRKGRNTVGSQKIVEKKPSKAELKKEKEKRLSAQKSIPYREMAKDGICRVQEKYYSKTIRFYDINYQLAQNEDKNAIFENWCDFLNYFDSSIHFQVSFINHHSSMKEFESAIQIRPQNDAFDDVRMEYAQMLKNQLAKGNNGLVRTKYITFGIKAENIREAKPKLERIEADILNNFKVLGVSAYPLSGEERLQILYETFNPEEKVPFQFSYDRVLRSGMGTKDFIAPTSFVFRDGKTFQMGNTIGAASYLQILAPELTDKMLAEFLDMDRNLIVNLHIQSLDQMKAIKLVKSKVTDINRMKIEEQKKAVRSGYDMDIIPSDLNTYGGEAKRLLEDLQSRNERMFLVTVLFLNTAKTKQELDNAVFQTGGIAQKYNCSLRRLDYMQEQGLMSSVPLGLNLIPIKRALTTTSTAIFVRACEDVDDAALSYAEIKALATGNPYIREKMDLDIQVSKLKLMKANHTSQKYRLETDIAKNYPVQIAAQKEQIAGLRADREAVKPILEEKEKDNFSMMIGGKTYTDRKEAGTAILAACAGLKAVKSNGQIGEFHGFSLNASYDSFYQTYKLTIKRQCSYQIEIGKDVLGNLQRISNALTGIEKRLTEAEQKMENLLSQLATAQEEVEKPFPKEAELTEKMERLAELNSLLNMDEKGTSEALGMGEDIAAVADSPRCAVTMAGRVSELSHTADSVQKPSVLGKLKQAQERLSHEAKNWKHTAKKKEQQL